MFTLPFEKISYKNVDIAGGKGASLGEITSLCRGCGGRATTKIKIPPGFIVLAPTFDQFLEETDLNVEIAAKIKRMNFKDINSVDRASNEIRDMISDVKISNEIGAGIMKEFKKLKTPFVAVRSSATAEDSSIASWAGELETFLNVTQKNLLESVKKCWSSLFTPRAIFYRFEKNFAATKVSVAVVVQKMIQSEISGICFTAHPVTKDLNQMIIEAGYGLGEAIVGGMITPDSYVIDKCKMKKSKCKIKEKIIDKNISQQKIMITNASKGTKQIKVPKNQQEKQKLIDKQILALAEICLLIEKHYGKPQDIEWAIEKGKIYITQSRPITTL